METEPHETIYALAINNDIVESKKIIMKYMKKVILTKYDTEKRKCSVSDEFLKEMEQELRKEFPRLGNSKFSSITSKKTKEEMQKKFRSEGIYEVIRQLIEMIEEESYGFETQEEIVEFATKWIDMFFEKDLNKTYERFAENYMIQELEKANKRKEAQDKAPKNKEEKPSWKTDMIKHMHQEEKTIKKEEEFLNEIFKNETLKKEIVKYISRLYRN